MDRPVIGYLNGDWDLFHYGHLLDLMEARKFCDYLVIGVNSDDVILDRGYKSIYNENQRWSIISSIKIVDYAIICNDNDYLTQLIEIANADVFIIPNNFGTKENELEVLKKCTTNNFKIERLSENDILTTDIIKKRIINND